LEFASSGVTAEFPPHRDIEVANWLQMQLESNTTGKAGGLKL
jgi:hypothetical protein